MPIKKMHNFINNQSYPNIGLLVLRLGMAGMMFFGHGLGKLWNFTQASGKFPDPLGIGSELSLSAAVFGEFFCSIALILGFMTRYASIPFVSTMLVAAFIQHGADPFAEKEKALLYLVGGVVLFFCGPGKFSVDAKMN
ncbi:DoxX family protein [Oligoflexaceae bacterium]|nr:DoxX family protein [Oligoflexaceae bacterium]